MNRLRMFYSLIHHWMVPVTWTDIHKTISIFESKFYIFIPFYIHLFKLLCYITSLSLCYASIDTNLRSSINLLNGTKEFQHFYSSLQMVLKSFCNPKAFFFLSFVPLHSFVLIQIYLTSKSLDANFYILLESPVANVSINVIPLCLFLIRKAIKCSYRSIDNDVC